MKIQHLLTEAIENPKGPAKIPTGSGKTGIDNPAHAETAYYEGDPDQFNFGAQARNYQALKTALARSGKQFNYIAVASSPLGRDTFVAVAPNIVWYKYESSSPAAGQNILYVNGVKTKTTDFISKTAEQQAAMLIADPAHIKLEKQDVFGYLSTLAKSERSAEQILAEISSRKDTIFKLVKHQMVYSPKESTKLQTINKLLAKKAALPQWLTFNAVCQTIQPDIAKLIVRQFDTIPRYAKDMINDYKTAKLLTTYDYINANIDENINNIKNYFYKNIQMGYVNGIDDLFSILNDVGYDTKKFDIDALAKLVPIAVLERMVAPGNNNQTGNMTKTIQDWLRLGIPKENIVAAFDSAKDQLIGHSILELSRSGNAEFADNTIKSIKMLGLEWPDFASKNIVKLVQGKKDVIIRTLLTTIKQYSDSTYKLATVLKTVNFLKTIGVNWPELAAIEKSINSMSKSLGLLETIKPKGILMKINEVTQLDEDLGTLAQLGVGPLIKILNQPYRSGGSSKRSYGSSISAVGSKFSNVNDIGPTSPIVDIGVIKKDVIKQIRSFFKREEGARAFALYIGGTPVLFATTDEHSLTGASRISRAAYDLTPFEQEYQAHIAATYDRYQPKPSVKTARDKEEDEYSNNYRDRKTVTKHYQGEVFTTSELSQILANIEGVAKAVNKPITAKAVMIDQESMSQRRGRYGNKPEPRIRDAYEMGQDLKVRLARYKNSKRLTVGTIEEFVKLTLSGAAKVVNFAGHPYQMATTSYDKIDPAALLRGTPFTTRYKSNDPKDYRTVDITYMFDRETNMLNPIKAEWRPGDIESYQGSQTAVLDVKGYLKSELKISTLDKDRVLPALLSMYKSSPNETVMNRIISIITALRKAGEDWPELIAIEKSLNASLASGKK